MAKTSKELDETKRLMGALVRMKPKQHEEMKVGKRSPKRGMNKSPRTNKVRKTDE